MTDPTDNTTTASSTWRSFDTSKNNTNNNTDTTYGTYEDDSVTDYSLRGTSDNKPYNDASTSGVRGYDPTDYSTTTIQDSHGTAAYDPITGAYEEHLDYRTDGSQRHHRERVTPDGTYEVRDVDQYDDGTAHVHREYNNPNTGTNYIRDYQQR